MSLTTRVQALRLGRTNMPAIPQSTYNADEQAVLLGVWAAGAITPSTVVSSRGVLTVSAGVVTYLGVSAEVA